MCVISNIVFEISNKMLEINKKMEVVGWETSDG
jgi:hypothetical protein